MSKIITFSRFFPSYHPRKGQETHFVEQIWLGLNFLGLPVALNKDLPGDFLWSILPLSNYGMKFHTIRSGHRFKVGDKFSPRVWSGKPYSSKQIIIAPDIEVVKTWDFEIRVLKCIGENVIRVFVNGKSITATFACDIAKNDGLEFLDFLSWFKYPKPFDGQIICWNKNIEY